MFFVQSNAAKLFLDIAQRREILEGEANGTNSVIRRALWR
jgi:hypothetical protein